ncbi:MAG: glycosyltransferase family 2 protein [Candidatus Marinimicrobia bacterium]|nr:glycosyltransferase family 2 protein [Candidatus Neomarinimicrobiota bacterium]
MKETVSVIIPTFNRSSLLQRALDSVLSQTICPHEIIVVDDGSTDETAVLVEQEYPVIIYFHQSNKGVSAARNRGIREASGDWIAFLDSDDMWLPEKLERQFEALRANPDMKLCHTDEIWIRNERRVNPMKKHKKYGGWIFQKCLPLCCISPSSTLIHRSIFDEIGLFDETLPVCEDYDFWLRVTARHLVLYVDEKLIIKYGGHEDQLSKKYWGMDRFRIQALEKILSSDKLGGDDRLATEQMLADKIQIYIQGAKKRGKLEEVDSYKEKWQTLIK